MSLLDGWTMPVQQASYAGVQFDVINIEDFLDRALIEHAYPFVNGADLESMGLNPRAVRISAVFFGDGYYTDFKSLLKVLESNKPAVLVHPILGRMPNMLCTSANLRHDAENVNYVALELQFKEATEAQPIFVFENSVLTAIDSTLNKINTYLDRAMDYYRGGMEVVAAGINMTSRVKGLWSAVYGVYNDVRDLLGEDKSRYALSSNATSSIVAQSTKAAEDLSVMLDNGLAALIKPTSASDTSRTLSSRLTQRNNDSLAINTDTDNESAVENDEIFGVKSRFDAVLTTIDDVLDMPKKLSKGMVSAPTAVQVAEQLKSDKKATTNNYTTPITPKDTAQLEGMLRLVCAGLTAKVAVQLIEDNAETMLPTEIEAICTQVRLRLLDALNHLRALQAADTSLANYSHEQAVSEQLRNVAHAVTQLAIAAINQKPPLMVRIADKAGTIQQQAHWIYGDYTRANELLRLNAHIRQPNFIDKGTVLNSYAI